MPTAGYERLGGSLELQEVAPKDKMDRLECNFAGDKKILLLSEMLRDVGR